MKKTGLFHNPQAGEGDTEKKELLGLLKARGLDCRYFSTKQKKWPDDLPEIDHAVIAGGDGTVRKVIKKVLKLSPLKGPHRFSVIPMGTANNISRCLGFSGETKQNIAALGKSHVKSYDLGKITYNKENEFFIESLGFGLLPSLMKEMENYKAPENESAAENIQVARKKLAEVIEKARPANFKISVDGREHSGKYILAEVMNINAVGPRWELSPQSDPGDGKFEIVLIEEKKKKDLLAMLSGKKQSKTLFKAVQGESITIKTDLEKAHADDKVLEIKPGSEIRVQIKKGLFQFSKNS